MHLYLRRSPKKLTLAFLILLLPISASAGLFFWKDDSKKTIISVPNVRNMALLVATNTLLTEREKSELQIVDNCALVPETGPLGGGATPLIYRPQSDQISVYVVREGDTLSQIAEMYDVSINTIKWGNDLNSNTVKPGQTLVILPISGVKHIVAKGDTLASIAKKYKGDIDEIVDYNGLDKNSSLAAGSTIIIPDGEVVSIPYSNSYGSPSYSSGKEYAGYYIKPLAVCRKTQSIHGYNGVDLAAPAGTPVMAAASGQVIVSRVSGWNGGYGKYLVIKHSNGTQTLYAHLSRIDVSVGDDVNQGDIVGAVGSSGKSTGPHLHFEIRGAKNPF